MPRGHLRDPPPPQGELVTLVCGHHAGYTAAHLLNAQLASASAAVAQAAEGVRPATRAPVLSGALFAPCEVDEDFHAVPRAVFVDLHGACFAPPLHIAPLPLPAAPQQPPQGGRVQAAAARTLAAWAGKVDVVGSVPPSLAARDPETAKLISSILAATAGPSAAAAAPPPAKAAAAPGAAKACPESWGDVLGCRVPQRALCEVAGVVHGADAWAAWDDADDAISSSSGGLRGAVCDAVQHFAEGCDRLCGVQVVADMDNAFAAVADALLEDLRDEYGRALPLAVVGVSPLLADGAGGLADVPAAFAAAAPVLRSAVVARRRLCCALAAAAWTEHADLMVPMTVAPPQQQQQQQQSDERACLERAACFALGLHGFVRPYSTPWPEQQHVLEPAEPASLAAACTAYSPSKFALSSVRLGASPARRTVDLAPLVPAEEERVFVDQTACFASAADAAAAAAAQEPARRLRWATSDSFVVPSSMQGTGVCAQDATAVPLCVTTRAGSRAAKYLGRLAGLLSPFTRGAAARPAGFSDMGGRTLAEVANTLLDLCSTQQFVLQR